MQQPDVVTELKDPDLNFTFAVRAYRTVTEAELRYSYALWRSQKKNNKPKRNQRVEMITFIGADE